MSKWMSKWMSKGMSKWMSRMSRMSVPGWLRAEVMAIAAVAVAVATAAAGTGLGATEGRRGAARQQSAMFRGEPTHRGAPDTAGVATLGAVAWRFETGAAVRSSAALWDGTVYVGSSDHHLYAIDAASGAEVWRFEAEGPVTSSPAVDAERVVFADRGGVVYAVARGDGTPRWRVATGAELDLPWGHEGWDYFTASPTLVDDLVLIGSGDGNLYALEAATGAERWRYTAGARIRTTPAVSDGTVMFGDSAGIFHALNLADGRERWRFETAGHGLTAHDVGFDRRQIYSSAAVHEGVVYFGSRDAQLYALDLQSGAERWRSNDGGSAWVISSPAVTGGRVYSARSSSGNVRALDPADGSEVWRLASGAAVFSSPVVVGDLLYVGNGAGWLLAIDRADGTVRWRYRTGGGIWATPLVADGRLYIGSDDGFVYALEHTDGATPHRAVYWEESVPATVLGMMGEPERIRAHFERYGYEQLAAATLPDFLRARIDDGVASVIVFATDHLPDAVVEGAEGFLLQRYLQAGGKVVWMSAPPFFYVLDEAAAQFTGVDPQRAGVLMGIDASDYRSDVYPVRPTAEGLRWGLHTPWVGMGGFDPASVSQVLATDELGRAVCWVRSYGGAEGTGFVFLRPVFDGRGLDEVRAVAEYGVMRRPPARR
jgi:outer membrane protein assembly factor BamB